MRTVLCWGLTLLTVPLSDAVADVEYLTSSSGAGVSDAVIVEDVALAHTGQVLPVDGMGRIVPPAEQLTQAISNLQTALSRVGTGLERAVKINVYAASEAVAAETRGRLAKSLPDGSRPAVSYVVTRLPQPDARVALDAVAALPPEKQPEAVRRVRVPGWQSAEGLAHVSVLPAGRMVYISGQAERGEGLADATRKTMESLHATLKHLGLNPSHVVQVKAFLTPMSEVSQVERTIVSMSGDGLASPLSCVEWSSRLPIEIEMIAFVPQPASKKEAAATVRYVTPPGMTASPVFSRVAVKEEGRTIYVAGLYPSETEDAAAQVASLFQRLGSILERAGSDLRHLVKATYYVADEEVSRELGRIRQDVYDPRRPPAASKATVSSVGREGSRITLDMIAVAPR